MQLYLDATSLSAKYPELLKTIDVMLKQQLGKCISHMGAFYRAHFYTSFFPAETAASGSSPDFHLVRDPEGPHQRNKPYGYNDPWKCSENCEEVLESGFAQAMLGSSGDEIRRNFEKLKATMRSVVEDRTFFTTENGDYGICHESAREGDLIVLIPSAETPLIMRQLPRSGLPMELRKGVLSPENGLNNHAEQPRYMRLVGDCYVHTYILKLEHGDFQNDDVRELRIV